jgi:ABC-2 type transport system permease protein
MLARIINHERRILSAEKTLWLVVAIFALIIGYGVYNGVGWVRFQNDSIARIKQRQQLRDERVITQVRDIEEGRQKAPEGLADPRIPTRLGNSGSITTLPPAALAALSIGQSDLYPYRASVTLTSSPRTLWSEYEIENPNSLLTGKFDLQFALVYLFPLLILALSYNLLSAEKEQGTLALICAQPVTLAQFVTGKIVLRATVVLLATIFFSSISVLLSGANLQAEGALLRLLLWFAVVIAYGSLWFALAVAVNALGKSSATNALILASIWLALVVIAPSIINLMAQTLHPTPSRIELVTAMRTVSDNTEKEGAKLLDQYYYDHPELRADGTDGTEALKTRFTVQRAIANRIEPVLSDFDRQTTAQQALVNRYRYLSPAIVTQETLTDIAGTGLARHQHFRVQVEAYNEEWRDYFAPRLFKRIKLNTADTENYPRFVFQEEPAGAVGKRALVGLLGLLLPTVALFAWGLSRVRRYPISAS